MTDSQNQDDPADFTWTSVSGDHEEDLFISGSDKNVHLTKNPEAWRVTDDDGNDLGPVKYTGPDGDGWYTVL